jgi:hypothetical protein
VVADVIRRRFLRLIADRPIEGTKEIFRIGTESSSTFTIGWREAKGLENKNFLKAR